MYGQIKRKIVKAYLSFPECLKLPTIHYQGDSAVRRCPRFVRIKSYSPFSAVLGVSSKHISALTTDSITEWEIEAGVGSHYIVGSKQLTCELVSLISVDMTISKVPLQDVGR